MSRASHTKIEGAAALEAIFGYWPTFHDAEVLAVRLDRGAPDDSHTGPRLEAEVYVFEMTDQLEADGHYRLQKHALVTLGFVGIDNLTLTDFNHQNALGAIGLQDISDRQLERLKWHVHFVGSFGMTASFLCDQVEVVGVRRLDEPPASTQAPRQLPPSAFIS